jgi:hypothetical protein
LTASVSDFTHNSGDSSLFAIPPTGTPPPPTLTPSSTTPKVTFGQFTTPLQTNLLGIQSPESPGHSNSHTSIESDDPDELPLSVNLDVIIVPSEFLGKWYISVQAILKAVRAGAIVPVN